MSRLGVVELRPAQPTDAGKLGKILYDAQQRADWMPNLYAEIETIVFCGEMIDRGWVTVVQCDGSIRGFMARDGAEICSLYLADGAGGQGLAGGLIAEAKTCNSQLWLKVVAANAPARRFYQKQGFAELPGSAFNDSEEGQPVIKCVWQVDASAEEML